LERSLLAGALETAGRSQKDAAALLGLSYDRFRHLLRKYRLIGRG
jgi:DNA-binding protein Fis